MAVVVLLLLVGVLYSGLIPLMIPCLALGMIWIYVCKRAIVVKFSVKIPADQTLNESVISFLPWIILAHACFSIWSHTSSGLFTSGAIVFSLDLAPFGNDIDRVFVDALILAEGAFMLAVLALNYTLINFLGWVSECCKDELEVPVQWAAIENHSFNDRLMETNILGSYKIVNHPTYGHALKAFNELQFRMKKRDMEETGDALNPEFGMSR